MLQIVQRFVCKLCEGPIEPRTGVIIHGNVYAISDGVEDRGGIVGNNFPKEVFKSTKLLAITDQFEKFDGSEVDGKFKFSFFDVGETAYHTRCLCQMLEDEGISCA